MASRDYGSIYTLKNYMSSDVFPKYFDPAIVGDSNIGLVGYTSELIATIAEDTFNTATTYLNEMHPNLAILPETIYSQAALFQDTDTFATPAHINIVLFVKEKSILNVVDTTPGLTTSTDSIPDVFIDSDTIINIEGVQYMLDYDLDISVHNYDKSRYNPSIGVEITPPIYSVKYHRQKHGADYTNGLNNENSIYQKSMVITYSGEKFIGIFTTAHQVTKYTRTETVINSGLVNTSRFVIPFDNMLANFDVYCKRSADTGYTQLKKKLLGSAPDKATPFCYYRMTDENELEISFTVKDGYYKPDFGSEIIIDYYTTIGAEANFDKYTGTDIVCQMSTDNYDYNRTLVVFCVVQGASKYGANTPSIDVLKDRNIINFSTVGSYTVDNDIQLYFQNFSNYDNVKTYTVKKRDDVWERVFTVYGRYKNTDGDFIKTNTCKLLLPSTVNYATDSSDGVRHIESFTSAYDTDPDNDYRNFDMSEDGMYYISPGRKFVYVDAEPDYVITHISTGDTVTKPKVSYFGDMFIHQNGNICKIYKCLSGDTFKVDITTSGTIPVYVVSVNEGIYLKKTGYDTTTVTTITYNGSWSVDLAEYGVVINSAYTPVNGDTITLSNSDESVLAVYDEGTDVHIAEYANSSFFNKSNQKTYRYDGHQVVISAPDLSNSTVRILGPGESDSGHTFVYTTPYLIRFNPEPVIAGYYLTTVNDSYPTIYTSTANSTVQSTVEFISSDISVYRNSITGGDKNNKYDITVHIMPSVGLIKRAIGTNGGVILEDPSTNVYGEPIILGAFDTETGDIAKYYHYTCAGTESGKRYAFRVNNTYYSFDMPEINTGDEIIFNVYAMKVNVAGTEYDVTKSAYISGTATLSNVTTTPMVEYPVNVSASIRLDNELDIPLSITNFNEKTNTFTLTYELETDDVITGNKFRVKIDENTTHMIAMHECPVVLSIYYNGGTSPVNTYTTKTGITFIRPLNMMRSFVKFERANGFTLTDIVDSETQTQTEYNNLIDIHVDSFPLVAVEVLESVDSTLEFIKHITDHYIYAQGLADVLTGNFSLDMKYYNTYGRSKNFYIDVNEEEQIIYSTNISISFKIKPEYGANEVELIRDLKRYIKNYIESINESGSNSIYISNLIQSIENEFEYVRYMKYGGITAVIPYSTDTQIIENKSIDVDTLTVEERKVYVPEFLTLSVDDVNITII